MRFAVLALAALPALSQSGYVLKTVCTSGCDYAPSELQRAINDAAAYQIGTACVPYVIQIQAGAVMAGEFALPAKDPDTCREYVYLDSSRLAEMPYGYRVSPADAEKMPKLTTGTGTVNSIVTTVSNINGGAKTGYWKLRGLEFAPSNNALINTAAVWLGGDEKEEDRLATHIYVERCYIHGYHLQDGPLRGIWFRGNFMGVRDSYLADFKNYQTTLNKEGHGIVVLGGIGPIHVENNFVEAFSIGSIIGGSTPYIPGAIHTDSVWQGNYYSRRFSWWHRNSPATVPTWPCIDGQFFRRDGDVNNSWVCSGGEWVGGQPDRMQMARGPKNAWECKNCRRVLIEGNWFENAWPDISNQSQRGYMFLFNQVDNNPGDGYAPWSTIADVEARYNRGDSLFSFVSVGRLGTYWEYPQRINVHDNVMTRAFRAALARGNGGMTDGDGMTLYGGIFASRLRDINMAHNTVSPANDGYAPVGSLPALEFSYAAGEANYNIVHHSNVYPFYLRGPTNVHGTNIICVVKQHNLEHGGTLTVAKDLWINWLKVNVVHDDASSDEQTCALLYRFRTPSSGRMPSGYLGYNTPEQVFTDVAAGDYTLLPDVAAAAVGVDGAAAGADVEVVNQATAAAKTGQPNPWFAFAIREVRPSVEGAEIEVLKPAEGECSFTVDEDRNFDANLGNQTQWGEGLRSVHTIAGLRPGAHYYFKVTCNGYRREGEFVTLPE